MATARKKSGSSAAKASAPKRTAPPKAAPPAEAPLVDTSLAAQAAARMILGKAKLGEAALKPATTEKESGVFKQLKQSVNKPAAAALGDAHPHLTQTPRGHSVLDRLNRPQHSQTLGGFNRAGVPRRTPG